MQRYLISFDDGSMDHIPEEDSAGSRSSPRTRWSRRPRRPGLDLGWRGRASAPASSGTDGTITTGPYPETKAVVGGFSIIDVPSREEALAWAAKIAVACRCAQEVREIGYDPES